MICIFSVWRFYIIFLSSSVYYWTCKKVRFSSFFSVFIRLTSIYNFCCISRASAFKMSYYLSQVLNLSWIWYFIHWDFPEIILSSTPYLLDFVFIVQILPFFIVNCEPHWNWGQSYFLNDNNDTHFFTNVNGKFL